MKKFFLISLLVLTQVLGDIWLSRGMKQFGAVSLLSWGNLEKLFLYLFTSPWIVLGVATLAFSMLVYFFAISRLDVSYVLPMHASSYVLNALMAWLVLKEQVSNMRWLATVTIALGVFIVGWSEQISSQALAEVDRKRQKKSKNLANFFLLLFGFSWSVPRVWLGVLLLAISDSFADILTAIAVKKIGNVSLSAAGILQWMGKIGTEPLMLAGIALNALAFLCFIALLSWADISLIRPATAIGYIFSLLGSHYILQEKIARGRSIGIIIIGMGVSILSLA